ncbi:MAG: carbohydrate porin [Proteobacteria bacterium]|nr:carbohydrate porin [Pseudomonadota bacterium]
MTILRRRPAAPNGRRAAPLAGLALVACVVATAARADDGPPARALTLSGVYKLDVMGTVSGGLSHRATVLDNLSIYADLDLEKAVHWRGGAVHVSFLSNQGGQPGVDAGSLQGVNNIEVVHQRAKVYEAWIDQAFAGGAADIKAGLLDTNSEFNVTDSAGLFLAPTYGISSEIASTGPNGPSIFPSLALAARINVQPAKDVYLRFAAVNALANDLGDPGGVDTSFRQGLLLWGEAGWTGDGKIAVGAWGYTKDRPDLVDTLPGGAPKPSPTQGVYVMVDHPVAKNADGSARTSIFLRFGVSQGDTSPYRAAGSVGLNANHVFARRPDDVFGVGFSWGTLSPKFRTASAADGAPLDTAETAIEITYAAKFGQHFTLQPDLQYIHRPSGDPTIKDALVLGVRGQVNF